MPRRGTRTVGIPTEMNEWLKDLLKDGKNDPTARPLGIASKDEFARTAIAILAAALGYRSEHRLLARVMRIVEELERQGELP